MQGAENQTQVPNALVDSLLLIVKGETKKLYKELLQNGQGRRDVVSVLIEKVSSSYAGHKPVAD